MKSNNKVKKHWEGLEMLLMQWSYKQKDYLLTYIDCHFFRRTEGNWLGMWHTYMVLIVGNDFLHMENVLE